MNLTRHFFREEASAGQVAFNKLARQRSSYVLLASSPDIAAFSVPAGGRSGGLPMVEDIQFVKLDDPDRLASLSDTGLMNSPPEQRFDRLTRITARALGVPVSLISLVDEKRQFFKSAIGLSEPWNSLRETPLSHSFCQHVVMSGAPLLVSDARSHPLVCDNLAIPDMGVEAYLGIPLMSTDGQVLGSLCAIDGKPREWSEEDVETLADFAKLVEEQINLKAHIRNLMDIDAARELVSHELVHRIKNVFSVVQSLVRVSARNRDNLADYVEDLSERIGAQARAHDYIMQGRNADGDANSILALFDALLSAFNTAKERVRISGIDQPVGEKSATALALVIHELATNASKHGALSAADGNVCLSTAQIDDTIEILWSEHDGPKVGSPPTRKGFGSKMTATAVKSQLSGKIDYDWASDGLKVRIELPLKQLAL